MWIQSRRRSACFAAIVCGGFVLSCIHRTEAAEAKSRVRTWTDKSGEYTVQAAFVSYEDGIVVLEKADGTEVEVPFKELSTGDRRQAQRELRRIKSAASRKRHAAATARTAKRRAARRGVGDLRRDANARRLEPRRRRSTAAREVRTTPSTRPVSRYGISWHTSPQSASVAANADAEEKPIMWFRVLGDLEGYM